MGTYSNVHSKDWLAFDIMPAAVMRLALGQDATHPSGDRMHVSFACNNSEEALQPAAIASATHVRELLLYQLKVDKRSTETKEKKYLRNVGESIS